MFLEAFESSLLVCSVFLFTKTLPSGYLLLFVSSVLVVFSTTSTGTSIVNKLPSFPLNVTFATFLPKVLVFGYSISTISTPSGKFNLDLMSFSVKSCPCLTTTIPLTNSFDKSNSSISLIAGSIL